MKPPEKKHSQNYVVWQYLLCISISQWVLCIPFAGQKHLFQVLNKFSCLFPSQTEKRRKSPKNKEKIHLTRGLPVFRCLTCSPGVDQRISVNPHLRHWQTPFYVYGQNSTFHTDTYLVPRNKRGCFQHLPGKLVKTLKQIILTSKWCVKHQLASQNTQQIFYKEMP